MVVRDGDELARKWLELLEDPRKRAQTGAAASQAVHDSSSAVDRCLDLLDRWIMDPDLPGSGPARYPTHFPSRFPQGTPFITRLMDPGERAPGIRLMRTALLPPSLLMGMVVRLRNWMYDKKLLDSDRLSVPVISVGALTAGGAGKTPVVRFLARRLKQAGYRPAVLSRGYGRNSRATRSVAPGATWQEVGDEPAFLASALPGVLVIVGPSRTASGRLAIDRHGANVLLLDDGFQHRRTGREIDIVVHDASNRLSPGRLLPAGPFREPASSLGRAHALVLTRTDQAGSAVADTARIKGQFPHLALIEAVYDFAGLRRLVDGRTLPSASRTLPSDGEKRASDGRPPPSDGTRPPEWLAGRTVLVLCGIANPASFARTVADAGARVTRVLAYQDHHPFTPSELDRAVSLAQRSGAECIVTTEKDAVRIPPDHAIVNHLAALDIELRVTSGENALEKVLSTLDEAR